MMDFAPYQASTPSAVRALSPPATSSDNRRPFSPSRISGDRPLSPPPKSPPSQSQRFAPVGSESYQYDIGDGDDEVRGMLNRPDADGTTGLSLYQTSLGLNLRTEACLAYLMLPPAGGVLLLVLEWESDFVRFHAWQSALVFSVMFVIHLIFSWTAIVSWMLFAVDVGLIALLVSQAWKDAETLDRYELPFFGPLASNILDDE